MKNYGLPAAELMLLALCASLALGSLFLFLVAPSWLFLFIVLLTVLLLALVVLCYWRIQRNIVHSRTEVLKAQREYFDQLRVCGERTLSRTRLFTASRALGQLRPGNHDVLWQKSNTTHPIEQPICVATSFKIFVSIAPEFSTRRSLHVLFKLSDGRFNASRTKLLGTFTPPSPVFRPA